MNIYHPLEPFVPWVVQAALLTGILMMAAGYLVRRKLTAAGGGVLPDEGVTLRNILEVMIEALADLARDRIGEDWRKYFPIVGTMFIFILFSNLMGLIPEQEWTRFSHAAIYHGRRVCDARRPRCEVCTLPPDCPYPKRARRRR